MTLIINLNWKSITSAFILWNFTKTLAEQKSFDASDQKQTEPQKQP